MVSGRLLTVSSLIILGVLSLPSCRGDDVQGPDVSKNETDEGGIFGFTFSPLSFLFGSEDDDDKSEENEVVDDVTRIKAASQAGAQVDNTETQGEDRGETSDIETADEQAQEAGEELKDAGDDVRDTETTLARHSDPSADDVRASDAEAASAVDKGQEEVEGEIGRLKEDRELSEFMDEKSDPQPRDRHRKLSSPRKDTGHSKHKVSRDSYNITSVAVSDTFCQQSPNVDDLSRYIRTCQNCLVQWDRYQCPLHEKVLELEKWMKELQDLLSYGCRGSESCGGTDKCCFNRDPAVERALDQMTELAREMYTLFLESCSTCPRDGGWSKWCEWSSCSVSCGGGTRARTRVCDNPVPKGNGRDCQGLDRETIPCSGPTCCTDGNWSPWSPFGPCGVTCGEGMQERSRTCTKPPPNPCGRTCPGPSSDMQRCDSGRECCIDGKWADWSPWSSCSATCGRGTVNRVRTCSNPAPNYCGRTCLGSNRETQACEAPRDCCVHGNWSPWESWSPCTASCGLANRARHRRCNNPAPNYCGDDCQGESSESQECKDLPFCDPCIDGNWGPWQTLGRCSVTCGRGQEVRERSCNDPPRNECGRPCPGLDTDRRDCNPGPCCEPVDGNWGPWQPWGRCSVTCGRGQEVRERSCNNPPANQCGRPCPGWDTDRRDCNPGPCCVNGNWGPWSMWSACPVSCGTGQRERRRLCDSPAPDFCGDPCPGSSTDRAPHQCGPEQVDGNWGQWQPWGACSVTCGRGQEDRRRSCDNPPPNQCGRPCPGWDTDRRICNRPSCCVDGNWGQWEPWGTCSVTCSQGVRERRRRCNSPAPNFCGESCPGSDTDQNMCDTRIDCPSPCVDGQWSQWGAWSMCTVTCGMGQVERRRVCDSPSPNHCGRSCVGATIERTVNTCGPGPVDGNWGQWESWGVCSVTCGPGQQLRRRQCDNPSPNMCGRPCAGFNSDIKACILQPCCAQRQWSLWSPWSTCSATCGRGTRTRERSCQTVGYGEDCGDTCSGPDFETTECVGLSPCTSDWTSWEEWCPCDCRRGVTSRRRTCTQRQPSGEVVPVNLQQCGPGEARQERSCDVRKVCPVCVRDCTNRIDGNYGSCTSCKDYVKCQNGQMSIMSCAAEHHEWDAFIGKCRQGESPSCSLQPCVASCTGLDDVRVASCFGCAAYLECGRGRGTERRCPSDQEFNAHSKSCEVDMSPTCTRPISRNLNFMMSDAPADSYFDVRETNAGERYLELVKQTGVAAILGRGNDTLTLFKSQADDDKRDDELNNDIKIIGNGNKKVKTNAHMSRKHQKDVTCHTDCAGLEPGVYQSCLGCDQYLVCTRHGVMRVGRCPRNKSWDDKHKKCRKHSLTCNFAAGTKPNPGKS